MDFVTFFHIRAHPAVLKTVCRRCCDRQIARRATLVRPMFCFTLIALVMCSRYDEGGCGCGVVGQSAEQVCREVEATDAASVARLVRGVLCCLSPTGHAMIVIVRLDVHDVTVMAWSGGCGPWRAASSRGAPSVVVLSSTVTWLVSWHVADGL